MNMMINIYPGRHFSRLKLFLGTNRYFHNKPMSNIITSKECNYAIEVRGQCVKIAMANNFSEKDSLKIKEYIETVFKNRTILIDCDDQIYWLNDVKSVKIYTLNEAE